MSCNGFRCAFVALFLAGMLTAPKSATAAGPTVPRGFHATLFARGLANPTAMSLGPDKRLYVAQLNGIILSIRNGVAMQVAANFNTPLGLAWHGHTLYVSSMGSVSTLTPGKGYRSFRRRVIVAGLPTGRHQNDGMAFRQGWLYLGVGSTCNACKERDGRSATIMRFHLDGSHAEVYAHGLRNPYGLAFQPGTGRLYATDNGRDDFDDQVPDELNQIVRGGRYGWPDCWGAGQGSKCAGTVPPAALFEPHASADGLVFYSGHSFPASYRGDAFVAEYGATVGAVATGHRVKGVHFAGKRLVEYDFATGLSHPLAVTTAGDGALLVGDFGTGLIWHIQVNGR